uniref:ATP synthase complex subunit 8 n=2 Tax=Scatophagidae TaxID=30869 RepID=S5FV25_SCAAR|nr:ATP synthase F0 subunit 8 [Selenotoca multifasciata]AGQ45958.1 ATP synthase F0 subunit 8 [Scatophagus argus]AGW45846.1 ATP synthase F0 subunit 8 [Scatophagus argus]AKC58594.1 ATP synthase F0 subunit 8 [Selenotoca multifasciata]QPG24567.1 ATP synthase F0 subunit 8 [Scatophagus argus]
MPQLDPSPWFLILALSWSAFLTIIPAKLLRHTSLNTVTHQHAQERPTTSWTWPWH